MKSVVLTTPGVNLIKVESWSYFIRLCPMPTPNFYTTKSFSKFQHYTLLLTPYFMKSTPVCRLGNYKFCHAKWVIFTKT